MGDLKEELAQYQREAEEREAEEKANSLNLKYLNLLGYPIDPEALALLEKKLAEEARLIPVKEDGKKIEIACFDPNLPKAKKIIDSFKNEGYAVTLFIVSFSSLKYAWNFYKYVHRPKGKITGTLEVRSDLIKEFEKQKLGLRAIKEKVESFRSEKIGDLAEIILAAGIILNASDVHLEPKEKKAILRYRLDGLLYEAASLDLKIFARLINRIKLLSGMKLNIRDAAQDGRFTIGFKKLEIEIRASVVPSEYGEMAVLRILNPKSIDLKLEDLGFREDHLKIIKEQLSKPNGLVLNTGPTGSGKTTTLYTFLRHIQSPTIKIITIEDPIEYRLPGIDQTQVDNQAGYTFGNGLRSLLRHDPDVILVGEIRDEETAEIAIHSSLTGHLVISTLHTNDAVGSVQRLIDMKIVPSILASSLSLAIAQRLVRKLCKECAEFREPPREFLEALEKTYKKLPRDLSLPKLEGLKIGYPKTKECPECQGGYKGRIAIFELFVVDEKMERLISKKPTHAELLELAEKGGMTLMREDALIKIAQGITSIEEAERVVGKLF